MRRVAIFKPDADGVFEYPLWTDVGSHAAEAENTARRGVGWCLFASNENGDPLRHGSGPSDVTVSRKWIVSARETPTSWVSNYDAESSWHGGMRNVRDVSYPRVAGSEESENTDGLAEIHFWVPYLSNLS